MTQWPELPEKPATPEKTGAAPAMLVWRSLAEAERHRKAGHLAEAESTLRAALAAAPDHPEILYHLGVLRHDAGNDAEAAGLLERAIAFNEKDARYHAAFSGACLGLKRLDEALAQGKAAVALDPRLPAAHASLGRAYL